MINKTTTVQVYELQGSSGYNNNNNADMRYRVYVVITRFEKSMPKCMYVGWNTNTILQSFNL